MCKQNQPPKKTWRWETSNFFYWCANDDIIRQIPFQTKTKKSFFFWCALLCATKREYHSKKLTNKFILCHSLSTTLDYLWDLAYTHTSKIKLYTYFILQIPASEPCISFTVFVAIVLLKSDQLTNQQTDWQKSVETRPSRPIICAVWIVKRMGYPIDRPTNQPTDGHSQLLRCFGTPKKLYEVNGRR